LSHKPRTNKAGRVKALVRAAVARKHGRPAPHDAEGGA
jgi:hypothetical protein